MQLGLSTYTFPWAIGVPGILPSHCMQASDLLHYAADKKIPYVQFCDNLPLNELSIAERAKLKELAMVLGLNIEVGTRGLTEKQVLRYLPIAEQFNSAFLRIVIDDENYHPGEEEVVKVITALLPKLKQANVVLAIENHDRFPAKTLERIIKATDERWVGICLDTANSLGGGEGINEVLETLAPYTVNLHIKDFSIKRLSHKMGFIAEGCAAGKGQLDIKGIVEHVKRYNRCHTATLEVWSQPESTPGETIAKEKRWVEDSIEFLKTISL